MTRLASLLYAAGVIGFEALYTSVVPFTASTVLGFLGIVAVLIRPLAEAMLAA